MPTWTTDPPTTTGAYWWRPSADSSVRRAVLVVNAGQRKPTSAWVVEIGEPVSGEWLPESSPRLADAP